MLLLFQGKRYTWFAKAVTICCSSPRISYNLNGKGARKILSTQDSEWIRKLCEGVSSLYITAGGWSCEAGVKQELLLQCHFTSMIFWAFWTTEILRAPFKWTSFFSPYKHCTSLWTIRKLSSICSFFVPGSGRPSVLSLFIQVKPNNGVLCRAELNVPFIYTFPRLQLSCTVDRYNHIYE